MNRILIEQGSGAQIGRRHGELFAPAIRLNLRSFWRQARARGMEPKAMAAAAVRSERLLAPQRLEEIEAISVGAQLSYPELLAYNLYQGFFIPDECTVMIALGKATASGNTLFMKNSDRIGAANPAAPHDYKDKEINVVVDIKSNGSPRIIGVSAAGTTGLKMGLNEHGVAAGSNIARVAEPKQKKVNVTKLRAIDRAQLCRDALEKKSALEASQQVAATLLSAPMATPGNVEFADAQEAIIFEGAHDKLALETLRDGVTARSNCFVVLKELNQWDDISSQARLVRCQQLLSENEGSISMKVMTRFSTDHANGPGPNSICRHGQHASEDVSLSAAVIEIDRQTPQRSKISIALGKPCHAWRDKRGHINLDMSADASTIPQDFLSGEAWNEFYQEEVRE